jgi:hypothetical protein
MPKVEIIHCFAGPDACMLPGEIHEFSDEAALAQVEAGNVKLASTVPPRAPKSPKRGSIPDVETADDPKAEEREKR